MYLNLILYVQPDRVLRGRRQESQVAIPHPLMQNNLERAGLWHVANIPFFEYDTALISALVERWRPETHTFHLPFGECTITLQDVAFQLGLRIDGEPVSGCTTNWETHWNRDVLSFCRELLGVVPPDSELQGSSVTLTWLGSEFRSLDVDASEETIARHTRAFILRLIGGFLMADASAARVSLKWLPLLRDFGELGTLSWGSAVLANLYRQLCRGVKHTTCNIAGCLALLQSWAWYRIPRLRPEEYERRRLRFPLAGRYFFINYQLYLLLSIYRSTN